MISNDRHIHEWWSRLRHNGMLLSPAVMVDRFSDLPDISSWEVEKLRSAHNRFLSQTLSEKSNSIQISKSAVTAFFDTLLYDILGYRENQVLKQGQYDYSFTTTFRVGSKQEIVKPDRVIKTEIDPHAILLITDTSKQIGRGRGRTAYARTIELLRNTGNKLAILTNGLQLRLIYAGLDYDAWAEWEIERWFDKADGEEELRGLSQLLLRDTLFPEEPSEDQLKIDAKAKRPQSLHEAIEESRKKQADLSGILGEAVRRAVEHLTDEISSSARSHSDILEPIYHGSNDKRLDDNEVHDALLQASVRIVMRMVVCLFAEARGMLPVDENIYSSSYGIKSLFKTLEEEISYEGGREKLEEYNTAWPRLMALFRLIHDGDSGFLKLRRYGGLLFRPGRLAVKDNGEDIPESDAVLRALYVLEHDVQVSDATIYLILRKLLRGKFPVIKGRVKKIIEGPVDYTTLGTEFIGIIYEGLLDYKLKRAAESAQVFLNIGAEPVLPLNRLEGMLAADAKGLKDLLTKLNKEKAGKSEKEPESENSEKAETDEDDLFHQEAVQEEEPSTTGDDQDDASAKTSEEHLDADQRARKWAMEAVNLAGLAPRKKKRESEYAYEKRLRNTANNLIKRIISKGEFYLIRSGNVRKGTGTFYTKPQLAVPTVHRTLEPLCYQEQAGDDKIPKRPEEILSLKVCDPACGSASFLVAALHYLTDRLYESLRYHADIENPENAGKITLPFGKPKTGDLKEELLPFAPNDKEQGHNFEDVVKSILRRHVVERCIYGVDINPLAVEFARVSLWIETMDPKLPFSFLDHKIKPGNALVGCWLDRVLDYPLAAWLRDGGDGKNGDRTERIQAMLKGGKTGGKRSGDGIVKQEMRDVIQKRFFNQLSLELGGKTLEVNQAADNVRSEYETLHSIPIGFADDREQHYRKFIAGSPLYAKLKRAMDEWCAVWFWPMDEESAKHTPTPRKLHAPEANKQALIASIAAEMRFFHWEIEFPEVFTEEHKGFDAVIGNPPWDVMKPNSQEFFTQYDPLYRTYEQQKALKRQKELFAIDHRIADSWDDYRARFKAMSNWVKNVNQPFELKLARGKEGEFLDSVWSRTRNERKVIHPGSHPFRYQGSADLNSYKLFLETGYSILSNTGRLGLLVPSAVYTDAGSKTLRELFLEKCTWDWLFSFENRKKIFAIHGSFKFAAVIIDRQKTDTPMKTAFMIRDLEDWERKQPPVFEFDRSQIALFSPKSRSIPEVRTPRDLQIARKIYDNSFRIGDNKPGWEIEYTREFDMTNDSKLFKPREWWEAKGYQPDVFGRWIGPGGEVALPLYQGSLVWHFDPFFQKHLSGIGRSTKWGKLNYEDKKIVPLYLMEESNFSKSRKDFHRYKIVYRDIASSTNQRTMASAIIPAFPANNKVPILKVRDEFIEHKLLINSILCSIVFDYVIRDRVAAQSLNKFIIDECPIKIGDNSVSSTFRIEYNALKLSFLHRCFAPAWLSLLQSLPDLAAKPWKQWWAVTEADRLRLRVEIDALAADLYELDPDDYDWIVRNDPSDPKGFWRVDKQLASPEPVTVFSAVSSWLNVVTPHRRARSVGTWAPLAHHQNTVCQP
ncbi:MAG: hypothetical protein H8E46_06300, partial [FCB group bacterium]|nr:hypothetical protein [FCB group bacterium]